uniref:Integrase DNA-binding domain-containing protein n=1 Tax=Candidatus Kentrum sp. TUN TaxID=2126343 RepID=A0A450ZY30_9GAMM|nr:MAG: Domain of unknown function (DUF4102) [Candidatus Kentron sp. TUN]VFK58685.1 MAG: Domain of unknown function (DUF4102) [Candidatus Kentron sp. TUN]VFK67413.1 MAG: Domain of unknown function (DUF4102) [Candidatus Kentron sp. TUN]
MRGFLFVQCLVKLKVIRGSLSRITHSTPGYPLTNAAISGAKSREKAYKLPDSDGLFLLVTPRGKWWCLKYRYTDDDLKG